MTHSPHPDSMQVFAVHEPEGKDEPHCQELKKHLSVLIQEGDIRFSDRSTVPAGKAWGPEVIRMFDEADIILLLITPDFLCSGFCYNDLMVRAIERHEAKLARVIPIYLRPCDWQQLDIAGLQPLPSLRKPVTRWKDKDLAWSIVAKGIRTSIEELRQERQLRSTTQRSRSVPPPGSEPPRKRSATDVSFASLHDAVRVRSAYRLLNVYQRELLDVIRQALQHSSHHFGPFQAIGWGSHLFDLPVRRDRNPTEKWAYDYLPLGHAHIWWATEKKPMPGAIFVSAWHCSDDAVEEARRIAPASEPISETLRDNTKSNTSLSFNTKTTIRIDKDSPVSDWNYVDTFIEASPDYDESLWSDGNVHEASRFGLIRFGGFTQDTQSLRTQTDVHRLIIEPLLKLIDKASKL